MKNVLDNNQQVAHYFANSVQPNGKASNFYFETERNGDCYLFSYGRHFCVSRRLSADLFVFTLDKRSSSTAKHLAYARAALSHKTVVYCADPLAGAASNKHAAQHSIDAEMRASETERRIKQATRDAHKARAFHIAEQFNTYLAALPESERVDVSPFVLDGIEEMRAAMKAEEERKAEEARQKQALAAVRAREYLAAWRTDPTMYTQGMMSLPPALRLAASRGSHHTGGLLPDSGSIGRAIVETSRGAEIPVSDALKLWPAILAVKCGKRTPEEATRLIRRLGVYTLNEIRADGSIVVGCHDIAWSEVEYIAVALELIKQYRVSVRGKSSGRAEVLTMNTWPKMDVQQEAARLAASYGADVEKVEPEFNCEEVAA